ncbi:MAG: RluA family pseudouridine synthase [Desulfobacterales bacterium]
MSVTGAFTIFAGVADHNRRLDAVVAVHLPDCSRSLAANLIGSHKILVDNHPKKPGYRVKAGDKIFGRIPVPEPVEYKSEPIPLNILYQDIDIVVLNKPAGLVVHPAPGHASGTLVNALLHHCPDLGGIGGEIRPGIVHRLDKDTSGIMVVAKNAAALEALAKQFKDRTVRKTYLALVYGELKKDAGTIDLPIGRHPVHRKQMSTTTRKGRNAETYWRIRERFQLITLLELTLKTGRTHQIRVHCAAMNHPVVGDPIYRNRKLLKNNDKLSKAIPSPLADQLQTIPRQMLHAWRLGFVHPQTGHGMSFESPIPADMQALIDALRN